MASFNELLERGTKFVGDIADDVVHSSTFKTVIPGKEAWTKEFQQTVNSNNKIKSMFIDTELNNALKPRLTSKIGNVEEETADKVLKALHKSNYSDSGFEKAEKILKDSGKDEETAKKLSDMLKRNSSRIFEETQSINTEDMGFLTKAPAYARAYFSNPDKKVVNTRIAAAAGAYATVAVGGRYLSGGTLTSDNYGQKDIAGIPFI